MSKILLYGTKIMRTIFFFRMAIYGIGMFILKPFIKLIQNLFMQCVYDFAKMTRILTFCTVRKMGLKMGGFYTSVTLVLFEEI